MSTSMWRPALTAAAVVLFSLELRPQSDPVVDPPSPQYDLLLRGGRVLDGSGNPWVYADVAVRGGNIAAVGRLGSAEADRVIDGTGFYVMPGIIDSHSHANSSFNSDNPQTRATINNLMQGITTVVIGESGSPWPRGGSIQDLVDRWSQSGIGTNAALLAGIGSIRGQVLETVDAIPTDEQMEEMKRLVREAMEGGAFGISSALDYWNGHFSTTEEILALAREVAPYNGMYVSHIRSEGTRALWWVESHPSTRVTHLDALGEIISVGRAAGIRVHVLHIKSTGVPFWGKSAAATDLIEEARADGVDITANQYPYTASGPDRNTQLFKWEPYLGEAVGRGMEGPARREFLRERIEQVPEFAHQVEKDVYHEILARGGADRMLITRFEPNPAYEGMNLAEVSELRQESLYETARYLQLENNARIRSYSMQESDLEHYMGKEYIAPATDGSGPGPRVHPRSYGTFPRVLRRYVLDRGVMTLPSFVRKVTSLPASIMGFTDRGWIKEGYRADILVFDAATIQDHATFEDPDVYSEGVKYLLINGTLTIDDGHYTGELPGEVILRR